MILGQFYHPIKSCKNHCYEQKEFVILPYPRSPPCHISKNGPFLSFKYLFIPACPAKTNVSLTFVDMSHKLRYTIELIIHALFWAGVYYALQALTVNTFNVVIQVSEKNIQRVDGQILFPWSWIVLLFLMLLFYGALWLFKKIIHYKSVIQRIVIIAGWFMLIFALNYLTINWCMSAPVVKGPSIQNDIKVKLSQHTDDIHSTPSSVPSPEDQIIPAQPPGRPALLSSPGQFLPHINWPHMQFAMLLVFLAILAVAIAQFFIKEWVQNDLTRSHAEAHQFSTEIKFLRSQVNPHFLFNTLNNLFSMAQRKGNDDLADGISRLSGMMRYMLYESNTEKVHLQKEIEYLKDCIILNKLRYAASEATVTFAYPPPNITDVQVAPMLFIPFLENAFKHGVSIGQHSNIDMTIAIDQKRLIFTCVNTDHSDIRKPEEEKTGIGLANVQRRLELLYPDKHELHTGLKDGKYSVHLQIDWV